MLVTESRVEPGAKSFRKLWTRDEAAKLTEIFPGQRFELIEGELIDKMGQRPAHAQVIRILMNMLISAFPDRVLVQAPITLPDPDGRYSEPEPDLALLRKAETSDMSEKHPGPADVALLIEVSDTTLAFDRSTKLALYARCGIVEYWIVDIRNRRVIVCRDPLGEEYASVKICGSSEPVSPAAESAFVFRFDQIPL